MRGVPRTVLAVATAGLCALASGCGDDDDPITAISSTTPEATTATAATPEDFISNGDAICAEANAAVANLTSGTDFSSATAAQQGNITQGLIESLQALGDPEDPTGALAEFYEALEEQVTVLADTEAALESGDTTSASALTTELDAAEAQATTAASEYGFQDCGQEGEVISAEGSGTTTTPGAPAPAAPVAPTPAPVTPVEPAPVTPVEPAPAPAPPTGGTGTEQPATPTPAPTEPAPPSSGGGIAP